MEKIKLKIVNLLVGWKCNLTCKDCFAGVDILKNKISNDPTLDSLIATVDDLSRYISGASRHFTISGGEPFLYWSIVKPLIKHIRYKFPDSPILINTNGRLLHKYKDELVDFLKEINNISLNIAYHHWNFQKTKNGIRYQKELDDFFDHPEINKIHPLHHDIPDTNINFHGDLWADGFAAQWKREGNLLKPWATNNPKLSMENGCTGNICALAHESKLYKCPRLATLYPVLERVGQLDDPDWKKYLEYEPIDLSSDDQWEKIYKFKQEEGQPIDICDMCPSKSIINVTQIPHTEENVFSL